MPYLSASRSARRFRVVAAPNDPRALKDRRTQSWPPPAKVLVIFIEMTLLIILQEFLLLFFSRITVLNRVDFLQKKETKLVHFLIFCRPASGSWNTESAWENGVIFRIMCLSIVEIMRLLCRLGYVKWITYQSLEHWSTDIATWSRCWTKLFFMIDIIANNIKNSNTNLGYDLPGVQLWWGINIPQIWFNN